MRWGLWASLYASVNQKNGGGDKMRKSFWLISAGMAALAAPSFAQEPVSPVGEATPTQEAASVDEVVQDEGGAQDTDDIIVTATRRNEALSDVPLAVSAVTGQALENSGAADIRQLQQLSPSPPVSSTPSEPGERRARTNGRAAGRGREGQY